MADRMTAETALRFVALNLANEPLVFSTAEPDRVAKAQHKYGSEAVAHAIETFFAKLAVGAVALGVRRLVVGGGETAGAVLTALGLDELRIGREIDPGVPALVAGGDRPLGLALKSGNFGAIDFFEKALRALGSP